MAGLNLKQITDKLNSEFTGDVRKLVFWYDGKAEFEEDIASLSLENAKVLYLEKDNQFYIKYFLEYEDTKTNYLIYAPFEKPNIRENHLEDMIRYSKEFFADRVSLLVLDLGIGEQYKPILQTYIKFFSNKERTKKFYDLEIEIYSRDIIEVALMSVLCNSKTASFEEVLRIMLTEDEFEENKYLNEFRKYGLEEAFWQQVDLLFGYQSSNPSLLKLVMSLFVTYTAKTVHTELPSSLKDLISYKTGNIIAFLENLMNHVLYGQKYDEISEEIWNRLKLSSVFENFTVENLLNCELFSDVDKILIHFLLQALERENVNITFQGKTVPEICDERRKKHFGNRYKNDYYILENAYYIISSGKYEAITGIRNIVKQYSSSFFKMDKWYRYFYYYLDTIEDTGQYENLSELIENIYTNDFLNPIIVNWNTEFLFEGGETTLDLQRDFYGNYIKNSKEKTVVIISDAFRYETAFTLYERLREDAKCKSSITALQGVLPSYTPLGMGSLLPHKTLEYDNSFEVLVDGKITKTTEQRENLLKVYKTNSRCISFDTMKNMKKMELRDIFNGQDVVYVYHNQIDARGDAPKTENEVFVACEEAIEEIYGFIRKLSSQVNTHHFFVTADHGFIYKRDRIQPSDKISGFSKKGVIGQRYFLTENEETVEGICSLSLGKILGNKDERLVRFPLASDIFKVSGAGQNYVHGGSSPQELIVPLIEVKVEKGKKETSFAEIALVSLTNKITNLITTLEFVQTEPLSDVVKEARYLIYFISEDNERISNDSVVIADKKEADSVKRMFRLRFNFKNRKYDRGKKYYLVVYDEKNDLEILRHEVIIDIAFADDFGFFS